MMEELKLLVEMVAGLPHMALWVIAAFFVYKVVVVGSIYGVIRLAINKTHSWLTTPREKMLEVRPMLDGMAIDGQVEALMGQLKRLRTGDLRYLHGSHVDWLRQAIDDKIAKDMANEAKHSKP